MVRKATPKKFTYFVCYEFVGLSGLEDALVRGQCTVSLPKKIESGEDLSSFRRELAEALLLRVRGRKIVLRDTNIFLTSLSRLS